MKVKKANFIIKLMLGRYAGITLPPFGIYIVKNRLDDKELIAHEKIHWEQYERMGLFKYYLMYVYYFFKHGYKRNPMEVEARERSKNIT